METDAAAEHTAQPSGLLGQLDQLTVCHILSYLSLKELASVARVSRWLRDLANDPRLYLQLLERGYGLHLKASEPWHSARTLCHALHVSLDPTELAQHPTSSHIRFQALYTDSGVDEDMFPQFWADRAFQCNSWGAFCSKVSPNVHVLGVLKSTTPLEQYQIQLRTVCAELCKWAAGRLLARVPLPIASQHVLTGRQVRFYNKTAASLMRWPTVPADADKPPMPLFRLFLILCKAHYNAQHNPNAMGQMFAPGTMGSALTLGLAHGEAAPHTPLHDALCAVFGPDHPLCTAHVEGTHPWIITDSGPAVLAAEEAHAQAAADASSAPQQQQQPKSGNIVQQLISAIGNRYRRRGDQAGAGDAGPSGRASLEGRPGVRLEEYVDQLLQAVYWKVFKYAEAPANWAHPHGWHTPPAGQDTGPEPTAETTAESEDEGRGLSMLLDPRHMQVFDEQLAKRLNSPLALSRNISVMDTVAVSRAGNFTCPIRTGMLFAGSITPQTPSPEGWLVAAAAHGHHLPPPSPAARAAAQPRAAVQRAVSSDQAAQAAAADAAARAKHGSAAELLLSELQRRRAAGESVEAQVVEVTRGYLESIVSQPATRAADSLDSVEQVLAAVEAGRLPRVLQYKLLLNAEVIEFEQAGQVAAVNTGPPSSAPQVAAAPVPLQPVVWFRFFTEAEVKHMVNVHKLLCQGNSTSVTPEAHSLQQNLPWGQLPQKLMRQHRAKLERQWHQAQQKKQEQQDEGMAAEAPASSSSQQRRGKGRQSRRASAAAGAPDAAGDSSPATGRTSTVRPTVEQLSQFVAQRLVVMGADGSLEQVKVHPDVFASSVGLEQAAWGQELLKSQTMLTHQRTGPRTRRSSGGGVGAGYSGAMAASPDMGGAGGGGWADSGGMSDDSDELEMQIADMEDDGGPLNVQPAADVHELLDMMGYDPMPEEAGAAAGGGEGVVQLQGAGEAGAPAMDMAPGPVDDSDSDMDSEGAGGSEDDSSGDFDDDTDSSMWQTTDDEEDGSGPSDDAGGDGGGPNGNEVDMALAVLGNSSDDDPDMSEDIDMAQEFPDMLDGMPPSMYEHTLIVQMAHLVGMEPLTQSHIELERECQVIIDDALFDKSRAAKEEHAAKEEGGRARRGARSSSKRASEGEAGPSSGAKKPALGDGGPEGGAGTAGGRSGGRDPPPEVQFLPGDDTALDSVAFQRTETAPQMRKTLGMVQLRLQQRRAANLVCIKLISPENRMREMGDEHDDPNIDLQWMAFRGRALMLPPGLSLE